MGLATGIVCGLTAGISQYRVTETLHMNCIQRDGIHYAEQFYKLSNNQTAIYECEDLDSCESQCNVPIYNGNIVYVRGKLGKYHKIVENDSTRIGCYITCGIQGTFTAILLALMIYYQCVIYIARRSYDSIDDSQISPDIQTSEDTQITEDIQISEDTQMSEDTLIFEDTQMSSDTLISEDTEIYSNNIEYY